MVFPLIAVVLSATPLVSRPLSLALPGLNGVNLAPGEMQLHAETLAQKLIAHGTSVMTARDLETAMGIERQKQLLGCSEDNQCLIELTGALGVEAVVIGDLGRLEGMYVLNLKALSPTTGKPLGIYNARSKPDDLERMLENAVRSLLKSLAFSLHREDLEAMDLTLIPDPNAVVVKPATPPDQRLWALVPAGIGVGAFATGTVMQMVAGQKYDALRAGGLSEPEARALRDDGRGLETAASAVMIGGGVALGAALVVFLVTPAPPPVAPAVALGPNGSVSLGVTGVLP